MVLDSSAQEEREHARGQPPGECVLSVLEFCLYRQPCKTMLSARSSVPVSGTWAS